MPPFEIATDRLLLTPLADADAETLFAYRSRPEVSRYQHWEPKCLGDAVDFIKGVREVEFDTPGTWFQFGIRLRESGALVGDLGVRFFEDGAQAEIGFSLSPVFQGRGLATEAVVGFLNHLFGQLGKHRVCASVDPRNEPSLRLLRRVGMRQEAHFIKSLSFKGEWVDDIVLAILRSEWSAQRSASRC